MKKQDIFTICLMGLSLYLAYDGYKSTKKWVNICKEKDELLEKFSKQSDEILGDYTDACETIKELKTDNMKLLERLKKLNENNIE